MLNVGQDCTQGRWVTLGLVRRDPLRPHARLIDGTSEEAFSSCSIPAVRDVGVNDLAVLVDRSINGGSRPVQPRVRFINAPRGADWASMRTGSFSEQRQEALNPAIDGATVDHKTTFSEPLDNVGVAQAIPNIPPDRQGDHVIREAVVRESAGGTGSEPPSAGVASPALPTASRQSVLARPLAPAPNTFHS
jgi:hypothetical protein